MRLRVRDRRAIQLHGGYGKAPRGKLGRAEMTLPAKYLFASYSIVDSVCTGTHGRTALSRAGLDPTRAAVEEPRSGPDPPVGGSGRAGSVGCTGHLLPRLRLDCSNSFIRSRSVHPSMDALCLCRSCIFCFFFFLGPTRCRAAPGHHSQGPGAHSSPTNSVYSTAASQCRGVSWRQAPRWRWANLPPEPLD